MVNLSEESHKRASGHAMEKATLHSSMLGSDWCKVPIIIADESAVAIAAVKEPPDKLS